MFKELTKTERQGNSIFHQAKLLDNEGELIAYACECKYACAVIFSKGGEYYGKYISNKRVITHTGMFESTKDKSLGLVGVQGFLG